MKAIEEEQDMINDQQNKEEEDDLKISCHVDSSSKSSFPSKEGLSSKKEACCSQLKAEYKLSMFALTDTTGKTIDIKQTFAPKPWLPYGSIKIFILGWTISYFIKEAAVMYDYGVGYWWMFLSNWGISLILLCNILNLFQFVKTIYQVKYPSQDDYYQSQLRQKNDNNHTTFMTRLTSAVCTVTINIQVSICLLFWTSPDHFVTFKSIQLHGVLGAITIIDVIVVNRMPIRFKQIFLVYALTIAYLIWSLIHAATDIGNPASDNDPETDDDAIYSIMNWKTRPGRAAAMTGFLLILINPAVFFALWFSSTLLKPRYCTSLEEEEIEVDACTTDEI